jgi:hypothetical protein
MGLPDARRMVLSARERRADHHGAAGYGVLRREKNSAVAAKVAKVAINGGSSLGVSSRIKRNIFFLDGLVVAKAL